MREERTLTFETNNEKLQFRVSDSGYIHVEQEESPKDLFGGSNEIEFSFLNASEIDELVAFLQSARDANSKKDGDEK